MYVSYTALHSREGIPSPRNLFNSNRPYKVVYVLVQRAFQEAWFRQITMTIHIHTGGCAKRSNCMVMVTAVSVVHTSMPVFHVV